MRWSTTKLDRYAYPNDTQIQEEADTITRSDKPSREPQTGESSEKNRDVVNRTR